MPLLEQKNLQGTQFDLILKENQKLLPKRFFLSYYNIVWKRCVALDQKLFIIETFSNKNKYSRSNQRFTVLVEVEISIEHNCVRRKLNLSVLYCWNDRTSSLERNQIFAFYRNFGYWDSFLHLWLCHSEVVSLNAVL